MNRLVIIIIFLSLALILGRGLVWPKYQELELLKQGNKEKSVDIETKEEYIKNLIKEDEKLKNYQVQLAKIDSALPENLDIEVLLNFIQKVGFKSGLNLTDIKPPVTRQMFKEGEKKEGSEIKETEISFGISGSYTSFKHFLSTLQNSARLIEIESISFSFIEKEENQKFDLKIKVYSY